VATVLDRRPRLSVTWPAARALRLPDTSRLDALTARYNIAPGQMVPAIIATSLCRIVLMRWGLIPHWAKDEKTAYKAPAWNWTRIRCGGW
jgi:putative SOS response-associated peptidase YedK